MLGAIIGDIVGSQYEFQTKPADPAHFRLFTARSRYTDDTVMTLAVAEGLLEDSTSETSAERSVTSAIRKYGRMYPRAGYGSGFRAWLFSEHPKPYNSFGNGSAMRVSAVAWMFDSLSEVERYADVTARVTHNHPEGIKGAQATAAAIYLARMGQSKADIQRYIEGAYGYELSLTFDELRSAPRLSFRCQETVPEAIMVFLISNSFEDTLRKAVALGGDTDTRAAIAGSIAEAFYGIPDELKKACLKLLDSQLVDILTRWRIWIKDKEIRRYQAAFDYATRMHQGQKRIGGSDYITHPVAVAQMLKDQGKSVFHQVAGLFHDLLEDTTAAEEEIAALSSSEVMHCVKLLTKEPDYNMAQYVARIIENPMAKAVKIADRIHNLECAVEANEAFKHKYILETVEWYINLSSEIREATDRLAGTLQKPAYELLLPFLPYFESKPTFKWDGGVQESDVLLLPYPIYSDSVGEFITRFYLSGAADIQYDETLKEYGVTMDHESIAKAIPIADEKLLRAMLTCYIRQERFLDGVIGSAIENGNLAGIFKRMEEIQA